MTTTINPNAGPKHRGPAAIRAAQTARATWYPAVLRAACRATYAEAADVEGGARNHEAVMARRIIMGTARNLGMSSPAIGALLHLDHSSVLYGLRALTKNPTSVKANALCQDLADAIHRRAAA